MGNVLIGRGVQTSLINEQFTMENKRNWNTIILTLVDTLSPIDSAALVPVKAEDLEFEITALIAANLIYWVIIRTDTLAKLRENINFNERNLTCPLCRRTRYIKLTIKKTNYSIETQADNELKKPSINLGERSNKTFSQPITLSHAEEQAVNTRIKRCAVYPVIILWQRLMSINVKLTSWTRRNLSGKYNLHPGNMKIRLTLK